MKKLIKKIFKRQISMFEVYSVLSGISVAIFSILKGNGNYIPIIFGISLLVLIGVFIKNKQKNIVLLSMISVLGWLLILNIASPTLLTTTFSPEGFGGIPPQTYQECKEIGGIAMALNQDCNQYQIEYGNAGENFICCLPDTCQGEWKRIYNSETKVYEKVCNGG